MSPTNASPTLLPVDPPGISPSSSPIQPPELPHRPLMYTAADACALLRISKSHFHALVRKREFPQPLFRSGARFTRWAAADVHAWAADPAAWIAANRSGK